MFLNSPKSAGHVVARGAMLLLLLLVVNGCSSLYIVQYPRFFETATSAFEKGGKEIPVHSRADRVVQIPYDSVFPLLETVMQKFHVKKVKKTSDGIVYAKQSFEEYIDGYCKENQLCDNSDMPEDIRDGYFYYKFIIQRVSSTKSWITVGLMQQTSCEVLEPSVLSAVLTFGMTKIMQPPDTAEARECKKLTSRVGWAEQTVVPKKLIDEIMTQFIASVVDKFPWGD